MSDSTPKSEDVRAPGKEELEEKRMEIELELAEKTFVSEKEKAEERYLKGMLDEVRTRIAAIEAEEAEVIRNVGEIASVLWRDTTVLADGHTLAADSWGGRHFGLGIFSTALSATVGASIFSEAENLAVIAGILSLVLVVVSAVSTFLNPEQRSASHYKAGTSFRVLANKVQVLVDIDMRLRKASVMQLADELKKLTDERDELTNNSPRVPHRHRVHAANIWAKAMERMHAIKDAVEKE